MQSNRRTYGSADAVPTREFVQHPTRADLFYPVHKRPKRLAGVDYTSESCCCFVTYNLKAGCEPLIGEIGQTAWLALIEQGVRCEFRLHAACMMPDHVHLLLSPTGRGESVGQIVGAIKKSQFFAVRNAHGIYLQFQEMFWDHVVGRAANPDEEFEAIVWYIRQNPVAAGLVEHPQEYPFLL